MGYILIPFGIWLIISFVTYDIGYKSKVNEIYNEPRTKTNWNAIALLINIYELIINYDWKDKFKPKSPLDKEIAETEKEISELEKQKVKMDKLKELERRKERLFKEVNEEDANNQDYKPMPETMSVGHNSVVVGYTDNSEQTFYSGKHDFDKIKTLFQYGLPIEEQDVRS